EAGVARGWSLRGARRRAADGNPRDDDEAARRRSGEPLEAADERCRPRGVRGRRRRHAGRPRVRDRDLRRDARHQPVIAMADGAAVMTESRRWGDFEVSAEELERELHRLRPLTHPEMAIRTFYRLYAKRQGKSRWGDKTPGYATKIRRIKRTLPEASFIHMI